MARVMAHDHDIGNQIDRGENDCSYLEEWQSATTAKPTCNMIHESGFTGSMSQGGHGLYKEVWMPRDANIDDGDIVL